MFEKFTERARKVMSLARQNAQRLNNDFIGTEHMLLGLLEEDGGVAAKTIKALGRDTMVMRREIDKLVTSSTNPSALLGQLPWAPRSKRVLQLAEEEAFRAGVNVIGTEHLLLGLFKEGEGIAAQVLIKFEITETLLRSKMKEILGPEGERIAGPKPFAPKVENVAIKVWLFKMFESAASGAGSLFYNNVRMEVQTVVLVDGIPFDRQEAVAASLAKDCNAVAYMIETISNPTSCLKE